jgi:hypothetical protein
MRAPHKRQGDTLVRVTGVDAATQVGQSANTRRWSSRNGRPVPTRRREQVPCHVGTSAGHTRSRRGLVRLAVHRGAPQRSSRLGRAPENHENENEDEKSTDCGRTQSEDGRNRQYCPRPTWRLQAKERASGRLVEQEDDRCPTMSSGSASHNSRRTALVALEIRSIRQTRDARGTGTGRGERERPPSPPDGTR